MKYLDKLIIKDGIYTSEFSDGTKESLTEKDFWEKYPTDISELKKDKGFGFCICGLPLEKVSKNSEDLCCCAQAYCEHKTGIIKKNKRA